MTRAIELQVEESAIEEEVERRRKKGGLIGSSSAESTSFIHVYYLPFVRFKFQYLGRSGLVSRKEITHYGDCFYRLAILGSTKNSKFVWEEEFYNLIYPELKTATISEKMHDGYVIPIALEQARTQLTELVNYLTTTMRNQFQEIESILGRIKWHTSLSSLDKVQLADIKNGYKVLEEMESKLRKRLEMESEAYTFQRVTESEIVFVPWYVAKFTSKKTTRYLAFDYRGKEDDYFTSKLNGEYVIADFFENGFHDTRNTLLPSYDNNRQHLNNGVENNSRTVFDNNPDHASLDNIRQTHGFETLQEAHLFSILSRTADKDNSISVSKVCDVMKQEEQSIDQTAYTRAFSTSESGLMAFINNNPKFAKWEAFYSGSQFKLVPQRIAIIDGSNVAYANVDRSIMEGRPLPSAENILRVSSELCNRGFYKIFVILDAGVEHSIASQSGYGEVKRMCQVVAAPARNKADEYIIQYARLFSAYIITNDRFRDWKESDEWVRSNIDKHLITFMILDGVVTFDSRLR